MLWLNLKLIVGIIWEKSLFRVHGAFMPNQFKKPKKLLEYYVILSKYREIYMKYYVSPEHAPITPKIWGVYRNLLSQIATNIHTLSNFL